MNKLKNLLLFIFLIVMMLLSVRGNPGAPTSDNLNTRYWIEEGPFELSPERGRFALLYSMVEDHSFQFSIPLARFTTPDVGYTNGNYVSLFAPGVSMLLIPSYLLGKALSATQVITFATIGLFALLNVFLIRKIAGLLTIPQLPATIGGLTFLFATPAFAYSTTLYQHHISTFIILVSTWLVIRYNTMLSLMIIWLLASASVTIDNPNFFMMLPVALAALGKFFIVKKDNTHMQISFAYTKVFSFITVILPISFFLWFNQMSYNNPLQLSGGIASVQVIDAKGKPVTQTSADDTTTVVKREELESTQNVVGFFKTRNISNGLSIMFLSPERGILFFAPVILFGLIGIYKAAKNKIRFTSLFIAIAGMNLLLYGMWGDPYGGWAFGSRYLIPSYAILAIFLAYLLHLWREKIIFLIIFFIILCYSVSVNTLGALTSSSNPPKAEAQFLEQKYGQKQEYTYQRNINLLNTNVSKSFMYQAYAKNYFTAWQYFTILLGLLLLPFLLLFSLLTRTDIANSFSIKLHKNKRLSPAPEILSGPEKTI